MLLSYAITLCNEHQEFLNLFRALDKVKKPADEIVVLLDYPKASSQLLSDLHSLHLSKAIKLHAGVFDNHFANWKNLLNSLCSGEYIFQIDADEMPHPTLLESLENAIRNHPQFDLFLIPRVNTVESIEEHHLSKWKWNMNSKGWINFPDYQPRLFRNSPQIRWINQVHETVEGHTLMTAFPEREEFSLQHHKKIDRQEVQNSLYEKLEN